MNVIERPPKRVDIGLLDVSNDPIRKRSKSNTANVKVFVGSVFPLKARTIPLTISLTIFITMCGSIRSVVLLLKNDPNIYIYIAIYVLLCILVRAPANEY